MSTGEARDLRGIVLLGLAVGIVLADSSVGTIALPEILARYDVEVETLAWAPGRSARVTPASCSACSCSRRSSPPTWSERRTRL